MSLIHFESLFSAWCKAGIPFHSFAFCINISLKLFVKVSVLAEWSGQMSRWYLITALLHYLIELFVCLCYLYTILITVSVWYAFKSWSVNPNLSSFSKLFCLLYRIPGVVGVKRWPCKHWDLRSITWFHVHKPCMVLCTCYLSPGETKARVSLMFNGQPA